MARNKALSKRDKKSKTIRYPESTSRQDEVLQTLIAAIYVSIFFMFLRVSVFDPEQLSLGPCFKGAFPRDVDTHPLLAGEYFLYNLFSLYCINGQYNKGFGKI